MAILQVAERKIGLTKAVACAMMSFGYFPIREQERGKCLLKQEEHISGSLAWKTVCRSLQSRARPSIWRQRHSVLRRADRKDLSFKTADGCMLILAAGDARIDNHKFKEKFHMKAKMLSADEVLELVGHPVGGVCRSAARKASRCIWTCRCSGLRRCSPPSAARRARSS